ncbi:MAG: metalloprotease TldD [Cyanobacteria bacterium REEB67]|nr:metalloprotease TldD [Cyanobacteria bacterium REEB67]
MNILATPQSELHRLFGLSYEQVQRVIADATKGTGGRNAFCDIFFQAGSSQSIALDQGVIKNTSGDTVNGAGVRVVVGDKTGYSHTDHVNVTNLRRCAGIARAIIEHSNGVDNVPLSSTGKQHNLYPVKSSPVDADLSLKIAILKKIDSICRAYDPRIINVSTSISTELNTVLIATSLGDLFVDVRPLIRLNVSCLAQDGNRRENGTSGGGGRLEFSVLAAEDFYTDHALTAAKEAIDLLSATAAPAGEMDVVLGSGWPGVLIHEAVGHGLEGDFNRKGTSAFSTLMGEAVASPLVTVIDDGTLADRRGSLNIDDEGTPTTRNVLIEKGKLVGYIQDKQNASLMKAGLTGNGRRQDFRFAPMPRMTNTYMAGGDHTPEEIIRSVKRGIFATTFGGGQVDITNGDFTFSATCAYLIEDGQLTRAVKGATLIGNGPKALHNVTMVGNDEALDRGIGTCGKNGQGVPVGVGMPTIRINGVTVGGQS